MEEHKDDDIQAELQVRCKERLLEQFAVKLQVTPLPPEITEQILDFAGVYASQSKSINRYLSGQNLNYLYLLSSEVPTDQCKGVEVVVWSHDQGWSSYPSEQGTYDGSWTFGELIQVPSDVDLSRLETQQSSYLVQEEPNYTDTTKNTQQLLDCSDNIPADLSTSPRHLVYKNLHARSAWQRHVKQFDQSHELVQNLKRGDRVALVLRSMYPGWCNFVRFAKVSILYHPPSA